MKAAYVALPLALAAAPVWAQDCDDPSLSQQGINACLQESHGFWDGILNNAYQQVIAQSPADREDSLRQAQRAWITYRDLTCEMEAAEMAGGTGEGMARFRCLSRLTERRARDLETYLRQ